MIVLFLFLFLQACKPQEEKEEIILSAITIPEESQDLFDNGVVLEAAYPDGIQTITASFNATDQWTASITESDDDNWLSVDPSSGEAGSVTITVTVQPNSSAEIRNAKITITCGEDSRLLSVSQNGRVPDKNCLTFTTEGTATLALEDVGALRPVLYYSRDAVNWTKWDYAPLSYDNQHPLYLYGDNPEGINNRNLFCRFIATGDAFAVSGNIMHLISKEDEITTIPSEYCFRDLFNRCFTLTKAPDLPATTLTPGCYQGLFQGCTSLEQAPDLPATNMRKYCYCYMFNGCINMVAAPSLPASTLELGCYMCMFMSCLNLTTPPDIAATSLADMCCYYMFAECTGLTTAPELRATTLSNYCYQYMFFGATSLITAPELPATVLASDCYGSMFANCSSLTQAPDLPATSLATGCYAGMFYGCKNLIQPPQLPATALASNCYKEMFHGCINLTEAPELPAPILTSSCYQYMFLGCKKLSFVKCLAENISAARCVDLWLSDVSTGGTFVKAAGMNDWPSGENGIPESWTVVDAE
ncbi:MAG: BACON domain-containing protein [Bacteroidales bacterium]|nr:BACON domain-containing protein [Bacteroidales bacterium]